MIMKKILLLSFFAVLMFGCSQKRVVESTYENGNPRVEKYYHKSGGELVLDREVIYYENKQKKMEGTYKELQRDGQWKAWYENGTLWSEGEYKNGKRNGLGLAYHENGKKYIEGMYKDDMRVGVWRFYDTTGVLLKEVNFDLVPNAGNDSLK
jgi:antitoxin component YwqK of YwqJK toxin-antitoxin module